MVELEKLLEAAMKPEAGFTWDKAGSSLDKVEKVLTFGERIIGDIDRSRTIGAALKIFAKQYGVDLSQPLPGVDDGIVPRSDVHKQLLTGMNNLGSDEVLEAGQVLNNWYATKKQQKAGALNAAGDPPAGQP